MSNSEKRLQIYCTEEQYAQLKEWSEESGKSMSELGRAAISEYTDQDRLERIERKIDELHALAENDAHTHKAESGMSDSTGVNATTSKSVTRMREIVSRLQNEVDNPDDIVNEKAVKRSVEDIAGGDDRTLRKYKAMMKERGLLFENPGEQSPLWTLDVDVWIGWMEDYAQLNGADPAGEIADAYPARVGWGPNGKLNIEASEDIKQ